MGEGGGGIFNEDSSPTIIGSTFEQNVAFVFKGGGGGILNKTASSPFVLDCTFIDNFALGPESPSFVRGGGMFNRDESNPLLINCTFVGNLASNEGNFSKSVGGGLSSLLSSPTVIECTFNRNEANNSGGGIHIDSGTAVIVQCEFMDNTAPFGGGILSIQADSSSIARCRFVRNHAFWGGAVGDVFNSSSTFENCTFFENNALGGGAALTWKDSLSTFTNCTFIGNLAEDNNGTGGEGGALTCMSPSSNLKLVNCTIGTNFASIAGGGIFIGRGLDGEGETATATITNSILWNNLDQNGTGESAQVFIDERSPDFTASVNFSTIDGLTGKLGGIGNIGSDPLFVDPDGEDDIPGTEDDDLRLQEGSPAIDAANNWGVPIDENDYDEDGVLCELFPVDLDGNPRFNADEADFDPGCGVPVVVDMGAYEYQFDPVDQVTFADLNGDNAVGAADLLGLLVSWGTCAKGCCLADLDIDGNVGAADLLALLANWGPCP